MRSKSAINQKKGLDLILSNPIVNETRPSRSQSAQHKSYSRPKTRQTPIVNIAAQPSSIVSIKSQNTKLNQTDPFEFRCSVNRYNSNLEIFRTYVF